MIKGKIKIQYKNVIVKNMDYSIKATFGTLRNQRGSIGLFRNIPKDHGCYAFFSESLECLYIGQTFNLPRRICYQHRGHPQYEEAKYLYIWKTEALLENLCAVENELICYFRPKYNKRLKYHRPSSIDYTNKLSIN
jgi:excinuclease UvrABC nuclease subunit